MKDPFAQHIEAGSAIPLPFDQFEPGDLPLGLALAPDQGQSSLHSSLILVDPCWMGSDGLIADSFRASQTRQKLERERIQGKEKANQAHFQVGRIVRKAIAEAGGVMPEDMQVPEKSIEQIQREGQQRLEQGPQLSLIPPEEE